MKRLIAFLILCVTACALAGGLTVKRFPIQSCIPDSGTQRIYWLGPFDAADVIYARDSISDRTWTATDSLKVSYNVDLWARTRLGSISTALQVKDSIRLVWSTSAISPYDTLYGVTGQKFVSDSLTRTYIESVTTTSPTVARLYGVYAVSAAKTYDVPTYLFVSVWMPYDTTGNYNNTSIGDSLAFRSNTVYGSVRFFKL